MPVQPTRCLSGPCGPEGSLAALCAFPRARMTVRPPYESVFDASSCGLARHHTASMVRRHVEGARVDGSVLKCLWGWHEQPECAHTALPARSQLWKLQLDTVTPWRWAQLSGRVSACDGRCGRVDIEAFDSTSSTHASLAPGGAQSIGGTLF